MDWTSSKAPQAEGLHFFSPMKEKDILLLTDNYGGNGLWTLNSMCTLDVLWCRLLVPKPVAYINDHIQPISIILFRNLLNTWQEMTTRWNHSCILDIPSQNYLYSSQGKFGFCNLSVQYLFHWSAKDSIWRSFTVYWFNLSETEKALISWTFIKG